MIFRSFIVAALMVASTADEALASSRNQAKYLTMPDGTKIAVEIWLPEGAGDGKTVPTMISFTRYWRAKDYDPPKSDPPTLAKYMNGFGYAYVIADVRGSGASFGTRGTEFSTAEIGDYYSIIDGITKQDWSNGKVGAIGVSYLGNAAELSVLSGHPALKVVVPQFTDFDWYTSLLFPGGLKNRIMSSEWGDMVRAMDLNDAEALGYRKGETGAPQVLGVKPVDGVGGREALKAAIEGHKSNISMSAIFDGVAYRDDMKVAKSLSDTPDHSVTIHEFSKAISGRRVPAFHWGSWMDAGTADGILTRFATDDTPNKYIIGAWGHGARHDADPYNRKETPVSPALDAQYELIRDFVAPYLENGAQPRRNGKELVYYTMGAKRWTTTKVWPPAGVRSQRFYFGPDHRLGSKPPKAPKGADSYTVDFESGTGVETRWTTQLGYRDVFYGDRREADKRLLTYTSPPLGKDLEITGHPVITLQMSSTHTDGAVIVYLESVAPDGRITMITEGELHLSSRKSAGLRSGGASFGPDHSFKRADAADMVPGATETVSLSLLPTSVMVPKGHALRVAIAGHDKDSFYRTPESGTPVLTFQANAVKRSFLDLPIMPR